MVFGLSRKTATEFSFYLGIPTLMGAGAYSVWKERALLSVADLPLFAVGLVFAFRSSSALAAAYGIAVTGTMSITTVVYYVVCTQTWRWPVWKAAPLVAVFIVVDMAYLGANLIKVPDGGSLLVPLSQGLCFSACTMAHLKWPGRSPWDVVTVRLLVGGAWWRRGRRACPCPPRRG